MAFPSEWAEKAAVCMTIYLSLPLSLFLAVMWEMWLWPQTSLAHPTQLHILNKLAWCSCSHTCIRLNKKNCAVCHYLMWHLPLLELLNPTGNWDCVNLRQSHMLRLLKSCWTSMRLSVELFTTIIVLTEKVIISWISTMSWWTVQPYQSWELVANMFCIFASLASSFILHVLAKARPVI